jgi:MFS family permease
VFDWWHAADQRARRAFVAAAFGWMLDAFDVMLYSMVVAALIEDPQLHLTLPGAGILNSVTLIAASIGGILFGIGADRFGRKRALMASVMIGRLATVRPHSSTCSSCRGGAGAASFLSVCCPRSSSCGCSTTSRNLESGRRERPAAVQPAVSAICSRAGAHHSPQPSRS